MTEDRHDHRSEYGSSPDDPDGWPEPAKAEIGRLKTGLELVSAERDDLVKLSLRTTADFAEMKERAESAEQVFNDLLADIHQLSQERDATTARAEKAELQRDALADALGDAIGKEAKRQQAPLPRPAPADGGGDGDSFQARVRPWLHACFGEAIAGDQAERCHRFLEEALELVQACGIGREDCLRLVGYVYGRPAGNPGQEAGGVMTTLAALCLAFGLDMREAGETELARVWGKIDAIRAKQAAKPPGSPLPVADGGGADREPIETLRRNAAATPAPDFAHAPREPLSTRLDVGDAAPPADVEGMARRLLRYADVLESQARIFDLAKLLRDSAHILAAMPAPRPAAIAQQRQSGDLEYIDDLVDMEGGPSADNAWRRIKSDLAAMEVASRPDAAKEENTDAEKR